MVQYLPVTLFLVLSVLQRETVFRKPSNTRGLEICSSEALFLSSTDFPAVFLPFFASRKLACQAKC